MWAQTPFAWPEGKRVAVSLTFDDARASQPVAGLDVFAREPIAPDHPLLTLPNVVATPHVGSASIATRVKMATLAVDNALAVLRGDPPLTPVP